MSIQSKTYYYSVYETLLEIEEVDHREQIRFVERNMNSLRQLDLEEYFEMLCRYHQALFEIGMFDKQIKIADEILELSIIHNIIERNGEDIFFQTLFKKAASLFNAEKIQEAEKVLKEILKIRPDHEPAKLCLINCFVKGGKDKTFPFRSISIGALLLSAAVIAMELSVVRPLFSEYTDHIELLRNFLFGLGVISLIVGEVWVRYRAVDHVLELLQQYREKRNSKID